MFKPLGKVVLVERFEEETKLGSGILYAATGYEKKAAEGIVLSIGDEVERDIKVGDHVLFAKYSGSDFWQNDKDCLLLSEDDILGKIE